MTRNMVLNKLRNELRKAEEARADLIASEHLIDRASENLNINDASCDDWHHLVSARAGVYALTCLTNARIRELNERIEGMMAKDKLWSEKDEEVDG